MILENLAAKRLIRLSAPTPLPLYSETGDLHTTQLDPFSGQGHASANVRDCVRSGGYMRRETAVFYHVHTSNAKVAAVSTQTVPSCKSDMIGDRVVVIMLGLFQRQ